MLTFTFKITAFFLACAAFLLLASSLLGCRFAAYQSPDGTRALAGSVLTDPKGSFSVERTPTTQKTSVELDSKSRADVVFKALDALD